MSWTIEAACGCNIGKIRRNNEDNFFFAGKCLDAENEGLNTPICVEFPVKDGVFFSVFDGMGGENFGEIASYTAAHRMQQLLQEKKMLKERLMTGEFVRGITFRLNDAVVDEQKKLCTSRMGTTMVGVYFCNRSAYMVNVGDSRAYLLRKGKLHQISEDHVECRPGRMRKKAPLTQHLGMDPEDMLIEPYLVKTDLRKDDRYLLCSDGVTDMLSDNEIAQFLRDSEDVEICVNRLIQASLDRGGRDNITAIVCEVAK